jgi:hypothetical protein
LEVEASFAKLEDGGWSLEGRDGIFSRAKRQIRRARGLREGWVVWRLEKAESRG